MTEPISCLCGSKRSIPIKPRERFEIPIAFAICLRCGHIYAKNILNQRALDDFYSSKLYRSLYGGLSVQEHVDKLNFPEKTETALWRIAKPFLPEKNGAVLEWGSSGGWNLIPFRDFGHSVLGLDVNVSYLEAGRKTYGLDLEIIDESTFKALEQRQFDLIILNHVLEHLTEPQELLRKLARSSSPNTIYLIGLPTIEAIKDYGFHNYFTVAHIHYFSKFSFESALNRSGFSLIETHRTHGGLTFVAKLSDSSNKSSGFRGVLYALLVVAFHYTKYKIRRIARILFELTGIYRIFRK
ncbi:MAG: class I SAM-dependent methyltransferase [Actinobacteria bacterium]|nr:class I SAM-dependent methyltransferase [Actinomycetota bacterium]